MLRCWRSHTKQRPSFDDIIDMLSDDLNERFRQESYHYSAERQEVHEHSSTPPQATDPAEGVEVDLCMPRARGVGRVKEGDPTEMQPLRDGYSVHDEDLEEGSSLSSSYQSHRSDNDACSHKGSDCHCVDVKDKPKGWPRNGLRAGNNWQPTWTPTSEGGGSKEGPLLNGHGPPTLNAAQC